MKGGLYIKKGYTIDSAFEYFIKNSQISYLTKGSFGIIFKCILNINKESPYENLRTLYKDRKVSTIIIKFSLLHYEKNSFDIHSGNENYEKLIHTFEEQIKLLVEERKRNMNNNEKKGINNRIALLERKMNTLKKTEVELSSVPIDNFENEVKIQTEIFNKTVDHLDPICPSIIYSEYFNRNSDKRMDKIKNILYEGIYKKMLINKENKICNMMSKLDDFLKKNDKSSFGLIGMEMMGDYETLHKFDYHKNAPIYARIAQLRLCELAVKTGYSHNDYHQSNILVNPNAVGYYGDKTGHVLLIDFGYTKKIPDDILDYIKKAYNQNNFYGILNVFYYEQRLSNVFPSGDGVYHFAQYPNLYRWIMPKNNSEEDIKHMNIYLTYLKDEYKKYEGKVDESGFQHKKLFVYGESDEKSEEKKEEKSEEKKEDAYVINIKESPPSKKSSPPSKKSLSKKSLSPSKLSIKRSQSKRSPSKLSIKRSQSKRSPSKRLALKRLESKTLSSLSSLKKTRKRKVTDSQSP